MADVDFVDNFEAMVLDQNPRTPNTKWTDEARAQTAHIWQEAANKLADELIVEGKALGLIAAPEADQPNQD